MKYKSTMRRESVMKTGKLPDETQWEKRKPCNPSVLTLELEHYGHYRMGLTQDEIADYLLFRAKSMMGKWKRATKSKLVKKFYKIAGANTGACGPNMESLMYRYDVGRFADVLFLGNETYWD